MIPFIEGIKTKFDNLVCEADGLEYVSWPLVLSLAGRPAQQVVRFPEGFALRVFNGAVVAVDMALESGQVQRTWLPVLNAQNKPIPFTQLTSRDVSDTINRCRAKAAAMVLGVTLPLYAGEKSAAKFLKELGIKPDTDLAGISPLEEIKPGKAKTPYVSWAAALAAARITDPDFHWEVIQEERLDPETGELADFPALQAGNTWLVGVKVTYKGICHTEYLPIMGTVEVNGKKRDHIPLVNPGADDWNRAVMRCLTKAIAVATGYGLSTYAGEDIANMQPVQIGQKPNASEGAATTPSPVSPQGEAEPEAQAEDPAKEPEHTEHSAKLRSAITRLSTISDPDRLKKAVEAAPGLFGDEAPAFIEAVQQRLAELGVVESVEDFI